MAQVEARLRTQAEGQPARVQELAAGYLLAVLGVSRSADRLRIADEGNVVLQELQAQNVTYLPDIARVAIRHMAATVGGTPPGREQAVQDVIAVLRRPAPAAPASPPTAVPQRR
jgi:hypothetical protein